MNQINSITVRDLAAGRLARLLLDNDGGVRDPAVLVRVRGDESAGEWAEAVRACKDNSQIFLGMVDPGTPVDLSSEAQTFLGALDLTLVPLGDARRRWRETVAVADPGATAKDIADLVSRNPRASMTLTQVLRAGERVSVLQAIDIESFAYSMLLGSAEFTDWLDRRGPVREVPQSEQPVIVERTNEDLRITLNRAERRNAYGRQLRDRLVDALLVAACDSTVRRVVLSGNGSAFCSGGDLAEFGTTSDLGTAHLIRTRGGAARLMHELSERIEVRLHGPCIGAGIELSAFASRVVAQPNALFRLPEVSMGLIPGAGGTASVSRRIGKWRTAYLALTSVDLGVEDALEWGLVDELSDLDVPPNDPEPQRLGR